MHHSFLHPVRFGSAEAVVLFHGEIRLNAYLTPNITINSVEYNKYGCDSMMAAEEKMSFPVIVGERKVSRINYLSIPLCD